jgi:hypothetical protein
VFCGVVVVLYFGGVLWCVVLDVTHDVCLTVTHKHQPPIKKIFVYSGSTGVGNVFVQSRLAKTKFAS